MASTRNSNFELARRLAQRGHEIVFVSHADIGQLVESRGWEFSRLTNDQIIRDRVAGKAHHWRPGKLLNRRTARLESLRNLEIEQTLERLTPDALLIDIEMHYAIVATHALNVPTLLSIVWFSVFRDDQLPPLHSGRLPPTNRQEQIEIGRLWDELVEKRHRRDRQRRFHWSRLRDLFRPVMYSTNLRADLQELANSKRCPLDQVTDTRQWLDPHVYTNRPILCFNCWEMEFPHEPNPNLHYVGPMVNLDSADQAVDDDSRERWQQVRKSIGERRLIYCSLGTFWKAHRSFFDRLLDCMRCREDWVLVIGLGGKSSPADFCDLPDNVVPLRFAPQVEILKSADCAINHGGITSINEAIQMGVPMVVFSTNHVDQPGCAARVAFHRLGTVGDIERDQPETIQENIENAMSDRNIQANIASMRDKFDEAKSSQVAESVIEQVVNQRRA